MARDHAQIYLSIWDQPDFLDLTAMEQRTYFALLTSKDLSYCGVHPLIPARLRTARGLTDRQVLAGLRGLAEARFVVTDTETAETAIRTYVRWDGILKMPNVVRAMNKAWLKVHSQTIRDSITTELGVGLRKLYPQGLSEAICKAIAEGFGKGFVEGFAEHFANSLSPFPLPPTNPNRQVANARAAIESVKDVTPGESWLGDVLDLGAAR